MPETKLAKSKTATVKSNNGLSAGPNARIMEHMIPHAKKLAVITEGLQSH